MTYRDILDQIYDTLMGNVQFPRLEVDEVSEQVFTPYSDMASIDFVYQDEWEVEIFIRVLNKRVQGR